MSVSERIRIPKSGQEPDYIPHSPQRRDIWHATKGGLEQCSGSGRIQFSPQIQIQIRIKLLKKFVTNKNRAASVSTISRMWQRAVSQRIQNIKQIRMIFTLSIGSKENSNFNSKLTGEMSKPRVLSRYYFQQCCGSRLFLYGSGSCFFTLIRILILLFHLIRIRLFHQIRIFAVLKT